MNMIVPKFFKLSPKDKETTQNTTNRSNSLCINVFVYGYYTKYIPFYIYSILSNYSDYYVKIFIDSNLNPRERLCLFLIRRYLSKNFSIIENSFPELKSFDNIPNGGMAKRAIRWLLTEDEIGDFNYVYIGDVDFLIFKESPGILEQHLLHCNQTGFPFSNIVRTYPDGSLSEVMSGLHFFKKKEYFQYMGNIIYQYRADLSQLAQKFQLFEFDEQFLFYIINQAFGITFLPVNNSFRPNHGFHLSVARRKTFDFDQNLVWNNTSDYMLRSSLNSIFKNRLFKIMAILNPEYALFRTYKHYARKRINFFFLYIIFFYSLFSIKRWLRSIKKKYTNVT